MSGQKIIVQEVAAATEVAIVDNAPSRRVKLLPIGTLEMRDGRGPYRVRDLAHAEEIVAATRKFFGSADMPADRDHQMAFAVKPGVGGTAKATAWTKTANLTAEADGIWANDVEWTAAAHADLMAREYRYVSPLFMARPTKDGGDVLSLKNFALVNIGALDLPAIAAGLDDLSDILGERMSLATIAVLLGLGAAATEDQIAASIGALQKPQAPATSMIAIAAGLAETAGVEEIAAAVGTLKATAAPDLSGYVPKAIADGYRDEVQRLSGEHRTKRVDDLVAAGVVTVAQRQHALDWFEKDEVAAAAFYKDAPVVVPAGSVIEDRKVDEKISTLTPEQVAACALLGKSEEDYLKALNEEVA